MQFQLIRTPHNPKNKNKKQKEVGGVWKKTERDKTTILEAYMLGLKENFCEGNNKEESPFFKASRSTGN